MKYKVGDRVRIKSLDWYNENKNEYGNVNCPLYVFSPTMRQYCGTIRTIKRVDNFDKKYKMTEDSCFFDWTDEMIECKVEEEASTKPEKVSTHSTFVETARGYLVEAIADLNAIDVSHMSDLEKSSLYCAKENIKDALNLLEE